MPFDPLGNFTRVHNWEDDRQNDIDIVSDRHDEEDDNFAEGLNDCMLRDGRSAMTGDLKMNNFQIKNVANGTANSDAVNKKQLDDSKSNTETLLKQIINRLWKIGDIKQSVKDSNHDNWFLCNGQAISRIDYSDLFALIGTNFGEGDGTTTFNLPDYRGKFLRGLGGDSAEDLYTTQNESLPKLTGGPLHIDAWGQSTETAGCLKAVVGGNSHDDSGSIGWSLYFDSSLGNEIYSGEHVIPINQAVNFFIKVKEEE